MTAAHTSKITVYSKGYCPYCKMAKATLSGLGLTFDERDITFNRGYAKEMRERSSRRTVPQIFIGDHHVGGNDDLQVALKSGALKKVLSEAANAA